MNLVRFKSECGDYWAIEKRWFLFWKKYLAILKIGERYDPWMFKDDPDFNRHCLFKDIAIVRDNCPQVFEHRIARNKDELESYMS